MYGMQKGACYTLSVKTVLKTLGPVCAIIGAQWGYEGKGKVTDILAEEFDVIARACGGANAGHTIVVNGEKHVFHLLPSGCLHEDKPVFLGSGMVVHLPTLLDEIQTLADSDIEIVSRLWISPAAHILFDFHKLIDGNLEEARSKGKIGTTKRGIGPAYMDKAERIGLRMDALLWSEKYLKEFLYERAREVEMRYSIKVEVEEELENILEAKGILSNCVVRNGPSYINDLHEDSNTILIEGAQATLLDIDHGTYPYVTSSATSLAGALQGLGIAPRVVTSCIGVAKAYCTRVGEGTFPTEVEGEVADRLRERGGEYGATTGRPRRCGWLDLADLRYAAMINGFTHWNITKLDVLDEEKVIPVRTGEDEEGESIFEELPGWEESTAGITEFKNLPENAQSYIKFIEERTGVPVALIGTGQGRNEMIVQL